MTTFNQNTRYYYLRRRRKRRRRRERERVGGVRGSLFYYNLLTAAAGLASRMLGPRNDFIDLRRVAFSTSSTPSNCFRSGAFITSFINLNVSEFFAANSAAIAIAFGNRSDGETTALTKPHSNASSAVIHFPRIIIAFARAIPTKYLKECDVGINIAHVSIHWQRQLATDSRWH